MAEFYQGRPCTDAVAGVPHLAHNWAFGRDLFHCLGQSAHRDAVILGTCPNEAYDHPGHYYGNGRFFCSGDVGYPDRVPARLCRIASAHDGHHWHASPDVAYWCAGVTGPPSGVGAGFSEEANRAEAAAYGPDDTPEWEFQRETFAVVGQGVRCTGCGAEFPASGYVEDVLAWASGHQCGPSLSPEAWNKAAGAAANQAARDGLDLSGHPDHAVAGLEGWVRAVAAAVTAVWPQLQAAASDEPEEELDDLEEHPPAPLVEPPPSGRAFSDRLAQRQCGERVVPHAPHSWAVEQKLYWCDGNMSAGLEQTASSGGPVIQRGDDIGTGTLPVPGKAYPYRDGDHIVIGPECFASADRSVLCWQGRNYGRAPLLDEAAVKDE